MKKSARQKSDTDHWSKHEQKASSKICTKKTNPAPDPPTTTKAADKAQHQAMALTIGTLLSSQRTDTHRFLVCRPPAGQPREHYRRTSASSNRLDLPVRDSPAEA